MKCNTRTQKTLNVLSTPIPFGIRNGIVWTHELQGYGEGERTHLHEVNYEIYKFMPKHDFRVEVCDQETDIITLQIILRLLICFFYAPGGLFLIYGEH